MKKLFLSVSLGISLACFLIPAISFAEELSSEEKCLAEAIYFEARDQPTIGMVAVALVVKNRVKSPRYPNTVCGVVRQAKTRGGKLILGKCQFSYFCDGKPERPAEREAWETAKLVAGATLQTDFNVTGLHGVTHYHAVSVQPWWTTHLEPRAIVGDHKFYSMQ